MFAVISYKNNQHKIEPNKTYKFDLIDSSEKDKKILFSEILLFSDDKKTIIGTPFVKNCSVEAEIVDQIVEKKVNVLKFHSKKRYKRTGSQRSHKTLVKIIKLNYKNEK